MTFFRSFRFFSTKQKNQDRDEIAISSDLDSQPLYSTTDVEPTSLIDEMLSQGRYSLLLRPQIVENLTEDQRSRAVELLNDGMALVPDGNVLLQVNQFGHDYRNDIKINSEVVVNVDALYLDRFPVTNAQYYEFVKAGGYSQASLWDPEVLPAVLDFVDSSGFSGPRFWKNGSFPQIQNDYPVVGVSWYEAAAYSRWVGKRLPDDAEWVKAGSWPVAESSSVPTQRKYPWGDSMDKKRANLWGSGPGKIMSVNDFQSGVSVGGNYQLIGNVWEWMQSEFTGTSEDSIKLEFAAPMKSVRGGAFDTYLDCQSTCQFQSGDMAMVRKHNIGFRCAILMCELEPLVQYGCGDHSELQDSFGSCDSEREEVIQ